METENGSSNNSKGRIVVSLPMRDGNLTPECRYTAEQFVVSLPMRDGNRCDIIKSTAAS